MGFQSAITICLGDRFLFEPEALTENPKQSIAGRLDALTAFVHHF